MNSGSDLFNTLFGKQAKNCATCAERTRAFGVLVCRLGKPEPKTQQSCAYHLAVKK